MRILELEQTSVPSVEELAERVGLSAGYLTRQFVACFGESPAAYGRRLRLNHAATRLLFAPIKLSAIARNFGFDNQPAFNRAFRRQHGVAPSAFVQQGRDALPMEGSDDVTPVVHIVERPTEDAVARRFFGPDIADHWRRLMADLPTSIHVPRRRAGLIYDSPAVVPAQDRRYDCAIPIGKSGLEPVRDPENGLDPVQLPGGYHAEIRGCSADGIGKAIRHLYSVWLPTEPQFTPEGDPMVHWWGETPDTGVTVTIRLHRLLDTPSWNMIPLDHDGGTAGTHQII